MRGVHAHKAAAVGARLLDCNLACGRSHRNKLLGNDFRICHRLAVYRYGVCLGIYFSVFNNFSIGVYRNGFNQCNGLAPAQILDYAASRKRNCNYKVQR